MVAERAGSSVRGGREYPLQSKKRNAILARMHVIVVVVAVIVSIFIAAVLSSDDKFETSANDRGDRTKSVEYIGKGMHAKRDGKIRKHLRPFPMILGDLQR